MKNLNSILVMTCGIKSVDRKILFRFMKIISWNVRGIGIFKGLRKKKSDILVLLETISEALDNYTIIKLWGVRFKE